MHKEPSGGENRSARAARCGWHIQNPFQQPVFHVKRPSTLRRAQRTFMVQLCAVLLPSRARPRCFYARLGPDNCPRYTWAGFKGDSHAPAGDSSRRDTVASDRGRPLPFSCPGLPSIANSRHEAIHQEPSTLLLILLSDTHLPTGLRGIQRQKAMSS
jgi:hypothetical protein